MHNDISAAKKIAILGSTGSIGTQTLDVIGEYPDRFAPALLVAGTKVDTLIQPVSYTHLTLPTKLEV